MRKFAMILIVAFSMTVAWVGAVQSPAPAVYVDRDRVAEAFANGGAIANAPDVRLSVLRRTGPGQAEVHENETDIFYVVEGEALFVTGGTMAGSRVTAPGQIRGTDIQGGEIHQLQKGDVIVIPAGTPHWFKEVPRSINYFTIKAIKD